MIILALWNEKPSEKLELSINGERAPLQSSERARPLNKNCFRESLRFSIFEIM